MYTIARPLFLTCDTALHVGTGRDLGVVDLPIQRERHTGFPKIESSGFKGAVRQSFRQVPGIDNNDIELVFGPEAGDLHAGAIAFTDARLLLFPVKSVKGVFAFVTCGRVLQQLVDDLAKCYPAVQLENLAAYTAKNATNGKSWCYPLSSGNTLTVNKHLVLEEYAFVAQPPDPTTPLTIDVDGTPVPIGSFLADLLYPAGGSNDWWRDKLQHDIVVLHDDDFRDFVEMSTEVITRVKIDPKTGTVATGQLFTEEYLPTDSVLYNLVMTSKVFSKNQLEQASKSAPANQNMPEHVLDYFQRHLRSTVQVGANATLGKGLLKTCLHQPTKTSSHVVTE